MPALPPVPNVLRVMLLWKLGLDNNALTRLHFRYSGTAPSDAVCDLLAADIYTTGASQYPAFLTGSSSFEGVTIEDLTSPTSGTGQHLASTAGTRTGGPVGAGMAVLVNEHIHRRYRGGKPRSYYPFGTASDLTDEQDWSSSLVANVTSNTTALMADYSAFVESGTAMGPACSVSYYQGFTSVVNPISGRTRDVPKLRVGGPVIDDITAWLAKARIGSQRRRYLQRT